MFGGGSVFTTSLIGYWNPATGMAESSTSISFFKVFKF